MTHPTAAAVERRCLVVDDEQSLRKALVRVMQGAGFDVLEASSGVEALDMLERERIALLLSDVRMPEMPGPELLRHVRERHPDVAVVMITAVAEVDVAVACLAQGAMDYITKPFLIEEIRARVAQALEKRRLLLENRDHQLKLEHRVREQAVRIESLFLAGLQSLADALELKDPYTRGHSERVSRFSAAIARELGMGPAIVQSIARGGHLHDVGKIGVREEVLNKRGPLTTEEYAHIMTHPVLGWRILRQLLSDDPVALNVVRSHHERLDGRGVPDQLGGDDIPREARIVSVADAFDAMRSRRPYRDGLGFRETLAELRAKSGRQFDAEVVEAFIAVAERGALLPESEAEREAP